MTINNHNRILVVEDDTAVADGLKVGLESEDYQVHHVTNGADAIAYTEAFQPDLILLDVRLPDGSGFDICKTLRQRSRLQPIIMLTVRSDPIDRILGLEMGADDYVTKPFHLRELISRVKAQLRRVYGEFAGADAEILYVSDLVIDRHRGQVSRGKEILYLTPIEFRLLVYLAQHPNQALTRTQIIEAVWGYEITPESERTINSHIRRLREKIEINPSDPQIIETVMGIGYRLNS